LLHLTKVAVACGSLDALRERMAGRDVGGVAAIVTRFRPTRHEELVGGSIYWIIKHQLIARQTILGFGEGEDRRCLINLDARVVPVRPHPRRAHQGWRYLAEADAPVDFGGGHELAAMPLRLMEELAGLGLI
jgi:hypothetical protein